MPEHSDDYENNLSSVRTIREGRQLAFDVLTATEPTECSNRIDYEFPEKFVDELSRQEVFNKHLFRPNTYLHKWWARRCGSTFRTILKQFAPDLRRTDYYAPGGLEGLTVLDPMMGGGTTLHEAIRLGANVIGADIDPIPVIQARASLSRADLADLRTSFNRFFDNLYINLSHYFQTECPTCSKPTDIQYSLYGVRKACRCRSVVQIDQYTLRDEGDRQIAINPRDWTISDQHNTGNIAGEVPDLISKRDKQCPACGGAYHALTDLPFYARHVPVAIAGHCDAHGMFFRSPSEHDLNLINQADQQRDSLDFGWPDHFEVRDGSKSGDLLRQNIQSYLDVFSSRQLLYLRHAIEQLEDHHGIEKTNLGLLISTSLEFNSMLCGYKGSYKRRPGAIRHTFALHAYSFQYTVLENNPVNPRRSSGNLKQLFHDRIERGRKWAALPVERKIDGAGKKQLVRMVGETDEGAEVFAQADLAGGNSRFWIMQRDSQSLPIASQSVDMVVTDPPYYDNVQYANLGAFFRVWLSRLLPEAAEWDYDESMSAVVSKTNDGPTAYTSTLTGIFVECQRVLKPHVGRMVFTFHHWDPAAWAELTIALKSSGFRLKNFYVVSSEHPISVHIRDLKSIRHDCVLVLASDGNEDCRAWLEPTEIEATDSETFCRQCGTALGWFLDQEIASNDIRTVWKQLTRGRVRDS